ncbi:MAG: sialate O-acetylesterase [Chthoniobacterales bacterium]
MKAPLLYIGLLMAFVISAQGELKLPGFFSDHMVLLAGGKAPIWGTGAPGEVVTITFDGIATTVTADANGRWRAELPLQPEGHNADITVASSSGKKIIHDVLWGEVWFCSGQSNMARLLTSTANADRVIAAAQDPKLRIFTTRQTGNMKPQNDLEGEWKLVTPENAKNFSAVPYYFGKKVREVTGFPVGMIVSAFNGSKISSWIKLKALAANPATKVEVTVWDDYLKTRPKLEKKYKASLEAWKLEQVNANREGRAAPQKPEPPEGVNYQAAPGSLFNAMVNPFAGYGIRGFLWYQGESDADGRAEHYGPAFAELITSWRQHWGSMIPFYYVQLPNYDPYPAQNWAYVRELQRRALTIEKTGMAITIDIGDAKKVHPMNKKDVGNRLARIALVNDYAQEMESTGPMIREAKFKDGKTYLEFDHANNLKTTDGKPPRGFEVASEKSDFKPAKASIDEKGIVLKCPNVSAPKYVRYAWAPNPPVNLVNGDGLPASPFRLDVK